MLDVCVQTGVRGVSASVKIASCGQIKRQNKSKNQLRNAHVNCFQHTHFPLLCCNTGLTGGEIVLTLPSEDDCLVCNCCFGENPSVTNPQPAAILSSSSEAGNTFFSLLLHTTHQTEKHADAAAVAEDS